MRVISHSRFLRFLLAKGVEEKLWWLYNIAYIKIKKPSFQFFIERVISWQPVHLVDVMSLEKSFVLIAALLCR
jgi:hypothetical protein